jgi:pSer/pThr/pTyr-binding forkhead associated (FHA) protein
VWRVNAFDRDGREVARFELASGELTIGREADRHLVLQSASVSRRHARIVVDRDAAWLEDLGSKNGTLVEQRPAQGRVALRDGDAIQVAGERLIFRAPGAGTATQTVGAS